MATIFAIFILMLSMTGHASCTWCVCKEMADSMLQKTLDYACGAGADCGPVHQNGACYNPNSVRAHCNYAVNSYFQKKSQVQGSCDFSGTAMVVTSDPSFSGCSFPATISTANTSTTPVTSTTPTTSTRGGTPTTTTTTPYNATPSNGVLGGINNVGPTTTAGGYNTDISEAGYVKHQVLMSSPFVVISSLMLFCG